MEHLPAQARLEVIGGWDSAEEARLRRLASDAGVAEHVHFAGQCGRTDIVEAYGRADAVVFTWAPVIVFGAAAMSALVLPFAPSRCRRCNHAGHPFSH